MPKLHVYDVLTKPVVTEKTTLLNELNKYTFKVAPDANKNNVKLAVEEIFDVKVSKVNVLNVKGKVKRFRGRVGKQSGYKKAIVTLAEGQTLDLSGSVK